jgi:hypothetical protein
MDDTSNRDPGQRTERRRSTECKPANWITTGQLDTELWNAIMADSSTSCEESEDFEEIDDYLGNDEEYEDEADERRATLRLLAPLRPHLAELLGGPPVG